MTLFGCDRVRKAASLCSPNAVSEAVSASPKACPISCKIVGKGRKPNPKIIGAVTFGKMHNVGPPGDGYVRKVFPLAEHRPKVFGAVNFPFIFEPKICVDTDERIKMAIRQSFHVLVGRDYFADARIGGHAYEQIKVRRTRVHPSRRGDGKTRVAERHRPEFEGIINLRG